MITTLKVGCLKQAHRPQGNERLLDSLDTALCQRAEQRVTFLSNLNHHLKITLEKRLNITTTTATQRFYI